MKNILLVLTTIFFCSLGLTAQEKKDKKWDVNNPTGEGWNWKDVNFTTDEGTWMDLDISPDGKTIVFDMLGDIYMMPISGGKARAIRTGIAWEVQPRFSPDGKRLLFTSDAGGGDNIWVMDRDGENARQITKEDFRLLNNASWSPDGDYIVARKHFTSGRSLGAGEMWLYHIAGGSGTQLTKRKNDQQDANEPVFSPDGRYIYYSEDMYPGGYFQYNKDPNSQIYVIKRYDRETGESETVVSGPGGAARPQISNDGKKIAYIKRIRTKTVLMIHDLESGEEYALFDQLSKDQQEAWAIFGVYPGFDWMPDDRHIIIQGLGKIWKVATTAVRGKAAASSQIPFTVDIKTKVAETVRFKNDAYTDKFTAKVIRHAVTAPDESEVVFNAIGHLYRKNLPNGQAKRLTNAKELEFEPTYAPDGRTLAYVTWEDEAMGQLKTLTVGNKGSKTLSIEKGIYRTPAFSPDGKWIVYRKDKGNSHQGFTHCKEPGIYVVPTDGSADPKLVVPQGSFPQFSNDGKRIFYQKGGYVFGSLTKSVESVNVNGKDKKEHFDGKYAQRYHISPDNQWVAWSELWKVYIAPFPKIGKKIGLTSKTKAVPVAQVAKDAGINIHWSKDSK